MPTIDITRPELIWPGKYDEKGNRVENRGTALPFQVIETIKEGRATREPGRMSDLFSYPIFNTICPISTYFRYQLGKTSMISAAASENT